MVRKSAVRTALLGATVILGGCDLFSSTGLEFTQLEVFLHLASTQVASGESVAVELQLINTGSSRATIRADGDCLAVLAVERGGANQRFRINPSSCWAPSEPIVVEAGATARHAWAIVAETEDGVPAEPGMYSVVADVSARVGDIYLPGAIRTLEVLAGE